jgi:purine-binding chemotaxis protein CheW
MIRKSNALFQRAAELRQAFDQSFAAAPQRVEAPTETFLAIGSGSDLYALRLAEISSLHADKKIVPLPSESTDLIGLASFRGTLVPVFDLRVLLGYSPASMPRWLVLLACKTPVGVAFERFDGYFAATSDAIARDASADRRQPHMAEAVRTADQLRPIVGLVSILDSITARAHASTSLREQ